MIEGNGSLFVYLDREDFEVLHSILSDNAKLDGEPIPDFSFAKQSDLETLIAGPRQRFFGRDAYPTLEEKAAFLFYSINKRQIFLNGNKRMSTLCLVVFLSLNGRRLDVAPGVVGFGGRARGRANEDLPIGCVFHAIVGTDSRGWWAAIPRDGGHGFHGIVGAPRLRG